MPGYAELVIVVGIALLVVGVVFLFIAPWIGLAAGALGLVFAFLWIVGISRVSPKHKEPSRFL